MTVAGVSTLFCAVLYAGLLALTPMWALAVLAGGTVVTAARPALETAPLVVWTIFLSLLVAPTVNTRFDPRLRFVMLSIPAAVGVGVLWNDILAGLSGGTGTLAEAQIIGREALAIFGLLLVENLFRNISARRQWNVVP